jgi:hypothetical protein
MKSLASILHWGKSKAWQGTDLSGFWYFGNWIPGLGYRRRTPGARDCGDHHSE